MGIFALNFRNFFEVDLRIEAGKDDSRKGAKGAKFGEIGKYLSLRSWRLGAKNFLVPGAGIEPARTFRSPGF